MLLTDLPQELLDLIPHHITLIEDLLSLSTTTRALRAACTELPPNALLRLCAAQQNVFFRPTPHYLVALTCRQLAHSALSSPEGVETLRALKEVREWHNLRFAVVNPTANWLDQLAGAQWYATPNFWNGGVSDAATISVEPERAVFQIAVYGELFGESVESYLREGKKGAGAKGKMLPREVRMDYVKYCVPDWVCAGGYRGLEVLETGPYRGDGEGEGLPSDQIAMNHILNCRRWRDAWAAVRATAGPDFPDGSWKQEVWQRSVESLGMRMLGMWRPEARTNELTRKVAEIRGWIEALDDVDDKPDAVVVPVKQQWRTYDFPLFAKEVLICVQKYWNGAFENA
ncbi:hypothetical protein K402DRAFT_388770 [Aulographum hederae CBS 113979]|uniref:Uncharacterized protein n=1 Tax=Aulographum hederae CBS 113979 TaxID=1176131 RepID=A0A6G1HDP0_9PEZI|nr:hypothetical protein K402DRAFT_388770 [Aulographum hederae CBS 113979]